MSKNLSLESLKGHLFEALEGVKNLSDTDASDCEKQASNKQSRLLTYPAR